MLIKRGVMYLAMEMYYPFRQMNIRMVNQDLLLLLLKPVL